MADFAVVAIISVGDPKRTKILTNERLRFRTIDSAKAKIAQLRADIAQTSGIVFIEDDRGHEFSFPADLLISISTKEDSGPMVL